MEAMGALGQQRTNLLAAPREIKNEGIQKVAPRKSAIVSSRQPAHFFSPSPSTTHPLKGHRHLPRPHSFSCYQPTFEKLFATMSGSPGREDDEELLFPNYDAASSPRGAPTSPRNGGSSRSQLQRAHSSYVLPLLTFGTTAMKAKNVKST